MRVDTEALIIGAGPAGSVAGAMLARAGFKPLVLEAGTFPRFVIGESMLPRVNDVLQEAGLYDAIVAKKFMPKPGALFLKGEHSDRFCFAEMFPGQSPAALQVVRADFDQTLATTARGYGADIRFQHAVQGIEFAADGRSMTQVLDVETQQKYEVSAKIVLDCSGYGRVLPKLLKLEKPSHLSPRAAVFAHFEGDERPEGDKAGDIWICIHPKGPWIWIIPFSNGRTSVGVVAEREMLAAAGKDDRERMMHFINTDPNAGKRLKNVTQVMKTTRLEGWSASVERFWGPGWVLCGNASEFLDPVFSSGVTLALESSHRAAKLAAKQLKGETVDWDKDYTKPMDQAVGVFRVFVDTWYTEELQRLLLAPNKADKIKRAITAVLGGYVLDDRNPFVRDARGTLNAALKFVG